ncbi:2-amino-4-hydroxy-6-hydroxymethyldihydropteridine diphosphokinase [Celerinatantimonas sp. MCCC 1A17872]|uniref:2-amino-4-hydroxy-6- hydroxymethyldihydropteridine diphosphokinase n=1 Tax=Celerinatantimonas sp. MCCC 1A17872 TaxID=3177514 RepID=UPI0038C4B269
MFYLCSLGSNITPEEHVPNAVEELIHHFSTPIRFSSFLYTKPCNIDSSKLFVNSLFEFTTEQSASEVKAFFNQLEANHGRDRTDPLRSIKDRALDLDIIFYSHQPATLDKSRVPDYLKDLYQELSAKRSPHGPFFRFTLTREQLKLGDRATTIHGNTSPS